MFVRFRRSHRRLKVYIVENVRRDGGVKQEIVAYLGSIDAHLLMAADSTVERTSILARTAFWEVVNPKLKALVNRLGGEAEMKQLRVAIHARIPWPMQPERDRLEVLKALAEAKRWHGLYEMTQRRITTNDQWIARNQEENQKLRREGLQEIGQANLWKEEAEKLRKRAHRQPTP